MVEFIEGDVFLVELPQVDAVYADPPYRGGEKKYGCDPIDFEDLVRVMENAAPVRAMSTGAKMVAEISALIPSARVCPWFRKYSGSLPLVHPTYSWEAVFLWGQLPKRGKNQRVIRDSLHANSVIHRPDIVFPTPKPEEFAHWLVELLFIEPSGQSILDLFSGSGTISRVAELRGLEVTAVDMAVIDGVDQFDGPMQQTLMSRGP